MRINREKRTIEAMVRIYCEHHHDAGEALCTECERLLNYAKGRLDNCPFKEAKPACNHCEVHCYASEMRSRVQWVMSYSGPRMVWRYPLLSLLHVLDKLRKVPTLASLRERR